MKKIIFIKLGGSLITQKDKPYTARVNIIKKLAAELKEIIELNKDLYLLIGNGAGSFGHYSATLQKNENKKSKKGLGFAIIQDSVERLNRLVVKEMIDIGIQACSLHASTFLTSNNGKRHAFFTNSLFGFLDFGLIPVVYGDIIFDEKLGYKIFSTEDLFSLMIPELKKKNFIIERIIHLTVVDGVLDKEKKIIPVINRSNYKNVIDQLYTTEGFDVTGGMYHKIKSSLNYAKNGIKTYIINGNTQEKRLSQILLNKKYLGTVFE